MIRGLMEHGHTSQALPIVISCRGDHFFEGILINVVRATVGEEKSTFFE